MQELTPRGRRALFAALFGIYVLNYADRFTLPAVAQPLQKSLGIGDAQLGLLGTAFLLVYALSAPALGALADRVARTPVIAAGVAVWSVATALTALCRTFPQLFAVRAVLGIGEASFFPAANSLIGDMFPMERRARVLSWFGLASPLGVFLGYAVGGSVAQRFGWQAAFLVVGLPGLTLALAVRTMREPARGESEGLTATGDVDYGPLGAALLKRPTIAFSLLAQVLAYFVLGSLSFWIVVYLGRRFGLGTAAAGLVTGGVFVVSGAIGTLAGGYLADRLLPRIPSARLLVPAVGFLGCAAGVALGLVAPTLPAFLVCYFAAGAVLSMYGGSLTALQQDVVPPGARSRVVALTLLIAHLFGDAFAPSLIGVVSEALGGEAGGGLQRALWLAPAAAALAGVVALLGCPYVARDREAMVAKEKARALA